jgi:hypothetical protein
VGNFPEKLGITPLPTVTEVQSGTSLTNLVIPGTILYYTIQLGYFDINVLRVTVTEIIPTNGLLVYASINQCPLASSADFYAWYFGNVLQLIVL